MKYLVTGATGALGSLVVQKLLDLVSAEEIVVSVRDEKKGQTLIDSGVEVRQGDFTDPESLKKAFAGIDRLLLISSVGADRKTQHENVVTAAKHAGVGFIAYTSIANADQSKNMLAPDHAYTEKIIKESGLTHAFLRNNWYLENEKASITAALAGAPWVTAAADGKIGWALKSDYAEAAAKVLAGDFAQEIFELSGQPLTYAELAENVEKVSGKELAFRSVSDEEYTQLLQKDGVPAETIPILLLMQKDMRENTLNVASSDFEKILGRPVTPIQSALKKLLAI